MSELFHPPFANNFVHTLVPKGRDLAAYVEQIAETTAALNRADLGLLEHCTQRLTASTSEGTRALEGWRECIRRRVNLQAVRFVPTVLAAVERNLGVGIHAHLEANAPEVLDRFRSVPRSLLEVVRVNAYLPAGAMDCARDRVCALVRSGELEVPIERLELARLREPTSAHAPDFPTVIVYLATAAADVAAIAATLNALSRSFAVLAPAPTLRREHAWPLGTHATLTQGFTLYKRYLRWLGLLDELYDPAFDHALCIDSPIAAALGDADRRASPVAAGSSEVGRICRSQGQVGPTYL